MASFDPLTGQYSDDLGRVIGKGQLNLLIEGEATRLQLEIGSATQDLLSGRIKVWQWEDRVSNAIRLSAIRMTALAAGGQSRVTQSDWGFLGSQLKTQYDRLRAFGKQIREGKLTSGQIAARAGMYGRSPISIYAQHEKRKRSQLGYNLARRDLDPQSQHCPSCLRHTTNGRFLPIAQVVPRGVDCECRGRCRCTVIYAKSIGARPSIRARRRARARGI